MSKLCDHCQICHALDVCHKEKMETKTEESETGDTDDETKLIQQNYALQLLSLEEYEKIKTMKACTKLINEHPHDKELIEDIIKIIKNREPDHLCISDWFKEDIIETICSLYPGVKYTIDQYYIVSFTFSDE